MSKAVIRQSERIYAFLLRLYPPRYRYEFGEEMKYVFSESLKDAYAENGDGGLIVFWARTMVDAGKSLVVQHVENINEGDPMKTKISDLIMQDKVFLWIALATGLILMIPLVAMQFTGEVAWTLLDFVTAGVLLFGMGSLYVLAARKMPRYRLAIAIVLGIALLYLWAELAVGIFTNWGS